MFNLRKIPSRNIRHLKSKLRAVITSLSKLELILDVCVYQI